MELALYRTDLYNHCTIGKLYQDDEFICNILEDKDRGLKKDWELATILSIKVPAQTAIPLGRYEIDITMSNRFKRALPILLDVPGFTGIRIHPGSSHEDTAGCLLPGIRTDTEECFLIQSRKAFTSLFKRIGDALLNEKVFITIQR